tara:strand:+ start:250 stop:807 length:558 start_codon:yes stop_codon:yes gene_type:complete
MPVKVRSGGAWVQVAGDGADGQDGSGGDSIPVGTIVMYNGDTAPTGWALCDGGGGRPDLRDKFIVGSGSSYNRGTTGGSKNAVLIRHSHSVSGNTNNPGNHTHNYSRANNDSDDDYNGSPSGSSGQIGPTFGNNFTTGGGGGHTHSISGNTSTMGNTENGAFSGNETGVDKNLPPYYAITFIIKV